ncbi:MAG: hypothetical protein AAFX92_06450 [Pseudomonadota bacterium]
MAVPNAWSYEGDRRTALDAARRQAADDIEKAVFGAFPALSVRMRAALFLAYRLSAPVPARGLLRSALALAARDAFVARSWPPPGRRRNDKQHDIVDAYLSACAKRMEGDTLCQDLLWATVLATVPDFWVPHQPIAARLSQQADEGEAFASVEILAAQLRGPAAGGRAWALRKSRDSLTAIVTDLAARRPSLISLHRAPLGQDEPEVGLVYRYVPLGGERCRLLVYDPLKAAEAIELDLSFLDQGLTVVETTADDDRPPILAVRHLDIAIGPPPVMPHWVGRLDPIWRLRRWIGRHRRPEPSELVTHDPVFPSVDG